jgi:hypothetical protein
MLPLVDRSFWERIVALMSDRVATRSRDCD